MKNSNKKRNIDKSSNTDETSRNKVSSNEHYDLRIHNIEISEQKYQGVSQLDSGTSHFLDHHYAPPLNGQHIQPVDNSFTPINI